MQWIQACLCSFIFRCLVGTDEPSRHMPLTFPPPVPSFPGVVWGWLGWLSLLFCFFSGLVPTFFWVYPPKKNTDLRPFWVVGAWGCLCRLPFASLGWFSRLFPPFAICRGRLRLVGACVSSFLGLSCPPPHWVSYSLFVALVAKLPGCQVPSGLGLFLFGNTLWVKLSRGLVGLASAEGRCPGDCQLASPIHRRGFSLVA